MVMAGAQVAAKVLAAVNSHPASSRACAPWVKSWPAVSPQTWRPSSSNQKAGMARLADCLHRPALLASINTMLHNLQRT
jgi:hypothetical protein